MRDRWESVGAASGAIFVAMFVAGGSLMGTPEDYGGPPAAAAAYFEDWDTRIQVGGALVAAGVPFLVWFLATVRSRARAAGPAAGRAGTTAFGCGLVSTALYLSDVSALLVGALRPQNMAASPELAAALLDYSFVAIAMATFLTSALLLSLAVLAIRDKALWPEWVGWLAVAAALAYSLRVGNLFTTTGPFTAGGALGFWTPVVALMVWLGIASFVLARRPRDPADAP
ncbi:MAG TPA: hypothetical protein VHG69_02720 [Thermoleophilaceae bacterium]|nr:hypothetical protein [Thermoleophilaceae bacterium]